MTESYKIAWKASAKKELRKIEKSLIPTLLESIESLASNPFPHGYKKLVGSDHLYRIRIGRYRIIYEIEDGQMIIVIVRVRHRKNVYENI